LPLLAVAACGTRVPRSAVIAAEGGGPVTIITTAPTTPTGSPVPPPAPRPPAAAAVTRSGVAPGPRPVASSAAVLESRAQPTQAAASVPRSGGPSSAGVTATPAPSATPPVCTSQGSPIVVGQVGTFSGVVGGSLGGAQPGLKAWAKYTNATGGIACHPVQLYSVDDGGDTAKANGVAQDFVHNKHVVAVNAFVPLTLNGVEDYLRQAGVPVVGGDLLSPNWNTDPNLYPQGTSFESVFYSFLKYAQMQGHTKVALFYCIEATPCTQLRDQIERKGLAAKSGTTVVYDAPISLAGSNFTQQCSNARQAGADAILVAAPASTLGAAARDCTQQNYHPLFITEGLAGLNSLADDPNLDGLALGDTTFPWMLSSSPAQATYHQALARYAPGVESSGSAANAWAAGQLLRTAILKLGRAAYGDITAALVRQGLGMIKNETLGGLAPNELTFTPGAPAALVRCGFIAQIKGGQWTSPLGNAQICEPP
jgi:branched-chain amino acid transport system substrate-binding protein